MRIVSASPPPPAFPISILLSPVVSSNPAPTPKAILCEPVVSRAQWGTGYRAAVVVNIFGQLGVAPSSQRFNDDIKPTDKVSETLLALKPVTFRYKKEIDPAGTS